MKITGTDIYMTRGDSECIAVTLEGYTPGPEDYVELTVRGGFLSDPVIHKKAKFTDGKAVFAILPEDTSQLTFRRYVYDVQLTYSGQVKTICGPSAFVIGPEVTYGEYGRNSG